MWWIIGGSHWSPLRIHSHCTIFINFSSLSHSLSLSFHSLKTKEKKTSRTHYIYEWEWEWWKGKEHESPSPDEIERNANYEAHWMATKGSTILFFPSWTHCFVFVLMWHYTLWVWVFFPTNHVSPTWGSLKPKKKKNYIYIYIYKIKDFL